MKYNYIYNEGKGGFIAEDGRLIPWISANPEPFLCYSFEASLVTLLDRKITKEELQNLNRDVLHCLNRDTLSVEEVIENLALRNSTVSKELYGLKKVVFKLYHEKIYWWDRFKYFLTGNIEYITPGFRRYMVSKFNRGLENND